MIQPYGYNLRISFLKKKYHGDTVYDRFSLRSQNIFILGWLVFTQAKEKFVKKVCM
jgi:hypothetical protein